MIKIEGISEDDFITICQKVAKNHSAKIFDYHSSDDIEQQIWTIILQQIDQFDIDRIKHSNVKQGLENWLNGVVSKRLKNYYRDTFATKQQSRKTDKSEQELIQRRSLQHPVSIFEVGDITDNLDILTNIEYKDVWDFTISLLSNDQIEVLDAVLSGEIIPQYYKVKLSLIMRDIIEEYKYECAEKR